jgi:hypothetical protein
MNSQPIIMNQSVEHLRSYSVTAACPTCKLIAPSRVNPEFSIESFLFYLCCGCIWTPYMYLQRKDMTCYNTTHFCQGCNQQLGKYTSL